MVEAKNTGCIRCFRVFCVAVCGLRPVFRVSPLSMRVTLNISSNTRPGNRQCDTCWRRKTSSGPRKLLLNTEARGSLRANSVLWLRSVKRSRRRQSMRTRALWPTALRWPACAANSNRRKIYFAGRSLHFARAETAKARRKPCIRWPQLRAAGATIGRPSSISIVRAKCGNTRGLCLVWLGQWTEGEREFRLALQTAEEQNDKHLTRLITHNLGTPAMWRGDFGEALRWLGRMLRTDSGEAPIPQEATAHLNIARCHLYRGEMNECEQHLDLALERCQLFNMVGQLGENFEAYGNLYRERGDLARAAEFYERAARSYDEAGIDLGRVELLEEQAFLSLRAGDAARARAQIDRLLERRPADKNDIGHFTASLARGLILMAQSEHVAARKELDPAFDYFHQQGLYYYEAQAGMALAVCDFASSQEQQMLERLRRVLDLAARYDYEYWLRQEIVSHPELFASEYARELLPADLIAQVANVQELAPQPIAAPVAVLTKPLVDLTINMLGPVEIVRDIARPFAADAWTTRRARDILCFIASRSHHRTPKDTIIDTFWRETDLKAVAKNFHPTMSHIRKALNSNQPLKQNFLVYRDGDYQLNPEFSYRIDTEEFDRLITDGEAGRRERNFERCIGCYERAVALYRGEFMQGSYEPWVDEQRSYYHEQYLRMLESLAAVAEKKQEWLHAMDLAQRILHEDPFREDIHCMVMRAQAAVGNRVAVKEQYETLRGLLQKELGVEPAMQTQKAYRDLVGN